MTDQTLTVRADEVQVGDRIDWLGTVSKRFVMGGLWCINTGPGISDPRTYLRPDTLITVTRPDPDAELVEAMARASREAWGAAYSEGGRERWLTAARAALAAYREYQAAQPEPALATPHDADDSPKMIIETLTYAQFHLPAETHVNRLRRLIDAYQRLRPVGADGKHGDLHTDHCGCADKLGPDLGEDVALDYTPAEKETQR